MSRRALQAAAASGLVEAGRPLLVLLSGGADSVCLLDVARELGAEVAALHVDHGLRAEGGDDERHCRELCERLGVQLAVERLDPAAASGNLQAWARAARYGAAERHAAGAPYATAHTATDQAETVLYRLATSPGRRALLGIAPRAGGLVRPLLEATREDTRAWCRARSLPWREDPSNADPRFARARVRHELLPVLEELNPRAVEAIARTSRELRDEAEVLDAVAREALARLAGGAEGAVAIPLEALRAEPPALARLVLRRAAELAAGRQFSLAPDDAERILALSGGGTRALDLGGGLRAVCEYGLLRFARAATEEPPAAVVLPVPGEARFGVWTVSASAGGGGEVALDADRLGPAVVVRAWRAGDRMRPAGLGGSKTLQDLFTDRKVPRELRRTLPVVEAAGEIAWVAGVAVAEGFRAEAGARAVGLSARRAGGVVAGA